MSAPVTYDVAMREVESIIAKIKNDEQVDALPALVERGTQLLAQCNDILASITTHVDATLATPAMANA